MTGALAAAMMILARSCLGDARREWALAMQAEFEIACEMGKPLAFASGCLIAALREMPRHSAGRFVLANHILTLGILVPMAGLQLMCAAGAIFPQGSALYGAPVPGSAQALYLLDAYLAAVPMFLVLWLLLCASHLRLAWALMEGDWQRVARTSALIAAGTITFLLFTAVLFVNDSRLLLQAGMLAIELIAIAALARWHVRLFAAHAFEQPER